MEKTFIIGEVLKPQGIKGELKIKPLTDDADRFKKLKKVIIDGQIHTVTGAKITPNGVFLGLSDICDRNTAELFRGKFLHVNREDSIVPQKGRYFIVDIIGCKVCDGETDIATITDVTTAKTDIITAQTSSGKTLRFPFLKDAVKNVDVLNKKFEVNYKRFMEIAVYED